MKEKIKSALKDKYKSMGFGDKAIDSVAEYLSGRIKEESEIETAISGVESLLKAFQGETDRVRTEKAAAERRLSEIEAKIKGLGGNDTKQEPDKDDDDKDTPAWAKAMLKAVKEQSERLDKLEAGKLSESRKQQMDKIIGQLPEAFRKPYQRIALDGMNEDEFKAFKEEVTNEVNSLVAEAKKDGAVFKIPMSGKSGKPDEKEATDKEVSDVLEGMNI